MVIHSARPQAARTTQNNPLKTNGPKNPDPSRIQTPTTLQLQRAGFHVEGQRFEPGRAHKRQGPEATASGPDA